MDLHFPPHACGLYLEHNPHKDIYQPLAEWAAEPFNEDVWVSAEEFDRSLAADEVWTLQWYPRTPVTFHRLAASSLEALLAAANEA